MVALDEVHLANRALKTRGPGLVGVFVGGNSGIGASTLKAFVTYAENPKVYILARTKSTATAVLDEAKLLNSGVQGIFIATDATLLADVSRVCEQIIQAESHINILVFTCGGFSATGRQCKSLFPSYSPEIRITPEGLDRKLVLNYYARMQIITQLLPLLRTGSTSHSLASVISILGAGRESPILESDLPLNQPGNYGLRRQFAHSIVSTDLLFERLASSPDNALVRFVHQFPGYVRTNQVTGLGLYGVWTPVRWLLRVVELLASPLAVPLQESGERTLFSGVSSRYPPRGAEEEEGDGQGGVVAAGSDGARGSGAYILQWNGEVGGVQSVLQPLREKGFARVIEEHFRGEVERVLHATS